MHTQQHDGVTYHCWAPDEQAEREAFEGAVGRDRAATIIKAALRELVEDLQADGSERAHASGLRRTQALVDLVERRCHHEGRAWREVAKRLLPGYVRGSLRYDFRIGGFCCPEAVTLLGPEPPQEQVAAWAGTPAGEFDQPITEAA